MFMEEKTNNILSRLRNGEKVACLICHNGYYIPYNTTADKAHAFNCSNENCNGHYNCDSLIDVE